MVQGCLLQLPRKGHALTLRAGVPGLLLALEFFVDVQVSLAGSEGQFPGDEVVPGKAVLDDDNGSGLAKVFETFGQYNLHGGSLSCRRDGHMALYIANSYQ